MGEGRFRFESFHLDAHERLLLRDGEPVAVNARYLDALTLLVRAQGRLVTKERLHEEVWRGVPVTDEALTQCIRTLRRQLGDDARRPRFIETVPKHGYRFIAPVEEEAEEAELRSGSAVPAPPADERWRLVALLTAAGAAGGTFAGLAGGLLYGFAVASPTPGAMSTVLVLVLVTAGIAAIGGAGVALGIAIAGFAGQRSGYWMVPGAATGGLAVGAVVKLLGLDAFVLLVGRAPGDITGAGEGALLGAALGLGARWALRAGTPTLAASRLAAPALAGAGAGVLVPLLGGRMMGGSLALLGEQFPQARLRLDAIGPFFGESGFGPVSQMVTGAIEGALFGAGVVGAMLLLLVRPAQSPGEPRAVHTP